MLVEESVDASKATQVVAVAYGVGVITATNSLFDIAKSSPDVTVDPILDAIDIVVAVALVDTHRKTLFAP